MRTREQEILYNQMINADGRKVIGAAILILNEIQGLDVKNQLLGLGCAVLGLFELYGFKPQDILGISHNILYDTSDEYIQKSARGFKQYLKDEWKF